MCDIKNDIKNNDYYNNILIKAKEIRKILTKYKNLLNSLLFHVLINLKKW